MARSQTLPRIGPVQLTTATFGLMQEHRLAVAALVVGGSAVMTGAEILSTRMGLSAADGPKFMGMQLAVAFATAALSAATTRALLLERRARWRLDLALAAALAVMTLAGWAIAASPAVIAPFTRPDNAGLILLEVLVGVVVVTIVSIKLALWPVGLAIGDLALTPARSWALTRGAFWAYLLAELALVVLIAGPLLVGAELIGGTPWIVSTLSGVAAGAATVVLNALSAALYRLRRAGSVANLADVFD
jgi:hypothetical protein